MDEGRDFRPPLSGATNETALPEKLTQGMWCRVQISRGGDSIGLRPEKSH